MFVVCWIKPSFADAFWLVTVTTSQRAIPCQTPHESWAMMGALTLIHTAWTIPTTLALTNANHWPQCDTVTLAGPRVTRDVSVSNDTPATPCCLSMKLRRSCNTNDGHAWKHLAIDLRVNLHPTSLNAVCNRSIFQLLNDDPHFATILKFGNIRAISNRIG